MERRALSVTRGSARAFRPHPALPLPPPLQRDLRVVIWTALATLGHAEGHAAAVSDLREAAFAVRHLTVEGVSVADEALAELTQPAHDAEAAETLRRRCAPMVEVYDALLQVIPWTRLLDTLRQAPAGP